MTTTGGTHSFRLLPTLPTVAYVYVYAWFFKAGGEQGCRVTVVVWVRSHV